MLPCTEFLSQRSPKSSVFWAFRAIWSWTNNPGSQTSDGPSAVAGVLSSYNVCLKAAPANTSWTSPRDLSQVSWPKEMCCAAMYDTSPYTEF